MKTQYFTASSLDGFIATPDHSLDWLFQFENALEESSYPAFIAEVGAVAMGSGTYEWLRRNHVDPESGEPLPWPYDQPAWVFTSRELEAPDGADVRFVSGDVRPVHAAMAEAAGGKNLWLAGGGDLVGQFHDAGLLDEIIVQVAPVTLGAGAPFLPRQIVTPPLRLVATKPCGGMIELRFEVQHGESPPEG